MVGAAAPVNSDSFPCPGGHDRELAEAILLLSKIPSNQVGDSIKEERLFDAVDRLLSFVTELRSRSV
uniref:Uncharacterized protein n=1 Tax=Oryza meridionalis TaxID=40149 RepID=A0A0E0F4S6_9ORYZ